MPPRRSRAKTIVFACALTLLGSTALILSAEIVVRIKYALLHKDAAYLVLGVIGDYRRSGIRPTVQDASGKRVAAPAPANGPLVVMQPGVPAKPRLGGGTPAGGPLRIETINGTTQWNPCAQRDIYYRVNDAGGRGPEWPERKPAGSVRILALGESSTFGAANPEDQTWPALLEKVLREQHGIPAEVLNYGVPGQRIEGMIEALPRLLDKYHPDLVVHYGGFNQTWNVPADARFLQFLHYRSMLYTYIEEKLFFMAEASALRLVPDTRAYEKSVGELTTIARARGARLVIVAQAQPSGATPREGTACAEKWGDATALAGCLDALMSQPDQYSRLTRSRMYKTTVLQRVLADVAAREHLPLIDPRISLVERDDSHRLFCDEIHLTDQGNAVLAAAIAQPLADALRRPTTRTP